MEAYTSIFNEKAQSFQIWKLETKASNNNNSNKKKKNILTSARRSIIAVDK